MNACELFYICSKKPKNYFYLMLAVYRKRVCRWGSSFSFVIENFPVDPFQVMSGISCNKSLYVKIRRLFYKWNLENRLAKEKTELLHLMGDSIFRGRSPERKSLTCKPVPLIRLMLSAKRAVINFCLQRFDTCFADFIYKTCSTIKQILNLKRNIINFEAKFYKRSDYIILYKKTFWKR